MNREFLNGPLDTLVVRFFFWCPEVKLEFQKKRCPEVRLGILDFTFRDRTEGDIQSS